MNDYQPGQRYINNLGAVLEIVGTVTEEQPVGSLFYPHLVVAYRHEGSPVVLTRAVSVTEGWQLIP